MTDTNNTPQELTPDEIFEQQKAAFILEMEGKAEELSKANSGAKVVPLYYLNPLDPIKGVPVTGFLKEPNRMTKANLADEITKSKWRGYLMALQACLMKDVSDPRLYSDDKIYDAIAFAAGEEAGNFITIALSQIKKKLPTIE